MRNILHILLLLSFCFSVSAQRFVKVVDTYASLMALNVNDVHTNVFVAGRTSVNDGGQGVFTYSAGSSATTNLGTVFKPTGYNGRWLRQYSGPLNVRWFGAKGDGVTADYASITNADYVASGNTLNFPFGTYAISNAVNNISSWTGNGSTLAFTLVGALKAVNISANNVSVDGFTISVAHSGATGDGSHGCPVVVGHYGTGAGFTNIVLRRLTLSTTKTAGNGLMITGNSANIIVDDVYFPASSTMSIAILAHWGGADAPTTATFHPHDIAIRNVRVGSQTYVSTGDAAVYLSACHNVTVDNVDIEAINRSAVTVFAGDYGYYYASPTSQTNFALTGISVKNVTARNTKIFGFYVDGNAPLAPGAPTYDLPVVFENCTALGNNDGSANSGYALRYVRGVRIINPRAMFYGNGIAVGESAHSVLIDGGTTISNRNIGISIGNGTVNPQFTVVRNHESRFNGTGGSGGDNRTGILIGQCIQPTVYNCVFGDASSEPVQYYGIRISSTVQNQGKFLNNYVRSVASGGTAYSLGSGGDTNTISAWINNQALGSITYSGGVTKPESFQIYTNNVGFYHGTGAPESSLVASPGSMYLRYDGASATMLYIKESGTSNTGWMPYYGQGAAVTLTSISVTNSVKFVGPISPSQITGNQNDYNPSGFSTCNVLRLTTDASRDLTGLQSASGTDGRILILSNVGAQNLVLKDESASSFTTNRFALTADKTLAGDQSVMLVYDATSTRWRIITQ